MQPVHRNNNRICLHSKNNISIAKKDSEQPSGSSKKLSLFVFSMHQTSDILFLSKWRARLKKDSPHDSVILMFQYWNDTMRIYIDAALIWSNQVNPAHGSTWPTFEGNMVSPQIFNPATYHNIVTCSLCNIAYQSFCVEDRFLHLINPEWSQKKFSSHIWICSLSVIFFIVDATSKVIITRILQWKCFFHAYIILCFNLQVKLFIPDGIQLLRHRSRSLLHFPHLFDKQKI